MLTIASFKWEKPGYRSVFTSEHVNTLQRMVARHYPDPHKFVCVTDDARGLSPEVEAIPLWGDHASLLNPTWATGPSCYRRLKVFSKWFQEKVNDRIVVLDLDVVICGDLRPLWNRDEPFLIWRPNHPGIPICASMFMLQPGAHREIWEKFDHIMSPRLTSAAGFKGSDQAWIRYCIGDGTPGWGSVDGVYGYKDDLCSGARNLPNISIPHRLMATAKGLNRSTYGALPTGARIVMFPGKPDPWSVEAIADSPWIKEHYR